MTNNSVRVQSPSQPVSSQALSPVACAAAPGNKSPPSKLGILSHLLAYSFLSPLKARLDLCCLAIIHLLFKAQVQYPLPETLTSIPVTVAAPSVSHTPLKRWVCALTPPRGLGLAVLLSHPRPAPGAWEVFSKDLFPWVDNSSVVLLAYKAYSNLTWSLQ